MIHQKLANYLIGKNLYEGEGFSLHQARNEESGCDFLLAVTRAAADGGQDTKPGEVQVGAENLHQVKHDALIRMKETGEAEGIRFQVFEYMDGEVLANRMGEKMEAEKAAAILLPLAQGLAELHRQGYVHGKAAPENIMLSSDDTPKILVTESGGAGALWAEESLAYQAPEALRGEMIDPTADIYSLGAIYYHLITGQAPYDAGSRQALLEKIEAGPPVKPTRRVQKLRFIFELVILKALAADAEKRFPDMETFAIALQDLSTGKKGMHISRKKLSRVWIVLIVVVVIFVLYMLQNFR